MFFNKKKFYTLLDIKNHIAFTPLIFVFILSIISFIVMYTFLSYEKKSRINTLEQNSNFKQTNILKNYINNIKYNANTNFDITEKLLSDSIYEVKGFINANTNISQIKNYLKKLEEKNNINFVIFNSETYEIIYGIDIIEKLRDFTSSKIKSTKFSFYMLKNIEYIGDNNLIYWLDNEKRAIQLSFFKNIRDISWYIGAFSKVDDLKVLTKNSIVNSLFKKSKSIPKSHFYFYDEQENSLLNYSNNSNLIKLSSYDIKDYAKDDLSYNFKKYRFKVFIKNYKNKKELDEINFDFQRKLYIGNSIILLIALFLIIASNIFSKFINTIFNRYNKRLERRNFLFKKWKERYELAIIASNDGLWDMDLETKNIFFSNKWLDMFGYKRGEVQTFDEWIKLIHKDDKPRVLQEYKKHIDKKSNHFICEYRIKDKNDNYRWVLVRGKEFNSKRMLMMSMDIDKRIELSKELRYIQSLTESGRIVIFKWQNDENLTIKFVSKSISSYGYSIEDFTSSKIKFIQFVYKSDLKTLKNSIKVAIENNLDSFNSIYRVVDKVGNIKWVYNRTLLIKDDYGKVTSFYGYLNDITKIKTNEEELKQKIKKEVNKNLEMDRLLVQQNKLASMGEMLGNIAHQWRQPLNNINLIIYFLRDSYGLISKDEFNENVKSAKLQLDFMSQTIDDFRNFYRPSKQIKVFNIKKSINQSLKIVSSSFEKNSIEVEIKGDNLNIKNYENEFEQVLVNILNNVVDAKKIKEQIIDFKAKVIIDIKEFENKVRVKIFNNCGNMDEKIVDRIFEPYFTTKFEEQGTGIGLYMTKIIVEKNMKGSIHARNLEDGVEFEIII